MTSSVDRARSAIERQAWREAFTAFADAEPASLGRADHERRAICAYLVGEDDACVEALETAHRTALAEDDAADAARCAFWLAFSFMMRGQMAQAGGWLARADEILERSSIECAASGYLLVPAILGALDAGDPATARDLAIRASELGERFQDADLRAFGRLGHGQALIAMGDAPAGTARLDDVMVSVTGGEVGPITSGVVYCAVILECMQLFDLPRASEWTGALSEWCDAQPDLVPYRGQCLVHRSQLLQAAGDWPQAISTAEAACARLADPPHPALGLAHYQAAELQRLVGAFDQAESEYRLASRSGHHPMPGLALLELARGDAAAAAASIGPALHEAGGTAERPALLAAAAEIFRAVGDLASARSVAEELGSIAASAGSDALGAMAAQALGAVLVGEGDAAGGLRELRRAAAAWQALKMPYEGAKVALLLGLACAAIGDRTSARLELDNARDVLVELGANPDLERLATLTGGLVDNGSAPSPAGAAAALSGREREVLSRVAAGETNRQIAATLHISQHTVGRHLENIYAKLGVTSRAAATAWAYEHDLL